MAAAGGAAAALMNAVPANVQPIDWAGAIEARLRALADAARATSMRAYLLDQFPFLGLPAPVRRAAVRDLLIQPVAGPEALLAMAEQLWRLPEREFRYTAIDLLRQHRRHLQIAHLAAIERLILQDPWWETVDGLANVVGAVVRQEMPDGPEAQAQMDAWARHPSLWVRRVAMLHQLGWRMATDQERLGRYATLLAPEQDFFIKKAIGWALRDYARWNPEFVSAFVINKQVILSRLTVREACRRITAPPQAAQLP